MRIYDSDAPPLRSIPSLLLGNDGIEIEGMRMLMYTSQDIYSSSLFFTSTLKVAKFRSARTKRKSKRLFRIVVSRSGKVADVHLQLPTPLCDVANLLNYFRNRKHLNKKLMLGNLKVNFHCSRSVFSFKHNFSVIPVNSCGKDKDTSLTMQRNLLRKACENIVFYICTRL